MTCRSLIVFLAATVFLVQANALDIKGLKVDQPVDCAAIMALETRSGTFSDACGTGQPYWYTETIFLNGRTMLRLAQSQDRILTSVTVGATGTFNFNEVLDALTLKYGQPTSIVSSVVRNRMGANFDQTIAKWADGPETITLSRHGLAIGKPLLVYTGQRAGEEAKRERAEKAQKAASNL
jgi:hypothetical protein